MTRLSADSSTSEDTSNAVHDCMCGACQRFRGARDKVNFGLLRVRTSVMCPIYPLTRAFTNTVVHPHATAPPRRALRAARVACSATTSLTSTLREPREPSRPAAPPPKGFADTFCRRQLVMSDAH